MLIFALPYDPASHWQTNWGFMLAALRKIEPTIFQPSWGQNDYPVDFAPPLISMVEGYSMRPIWPHLRSQSRNVAICVVEQNIQVRKYAANIPRYWDHIVAGSRWVEQTIRDTGFQNVSTISHGAPPNFKPLDGWKPAPDTFTIYSGGKLELRKSQDIVIQAVGHMMQRYADVRFVYDWYNPWKFSEDTIQATVLFRKHQGQSLYTVMKRSGIDHARCYAFQTQFALPEDHQADKMRAMQTADVGIFPNRAEGTGNSLMMEMMACGKPIVGLFAHGQMDVLDADDPLVCRRWKELNIAENGQPQSCWFEPDLDEVIAKLEWAYQHREELTKIGAANGERMAKRDVASVTQQYVDILHGKVISLSSAAD